MKQKKYLKRKWSVISQYCLKTDLGSLMNLSFTAGKNTSEAGNKDTSLEWIVSLFSQSLQETNIRGAYIQ